MCNYEKRGTLERRRKRKKQDHKSGTFYHYFSSDTRTYILNITHFYRCHERLYSTTVSIYSRHHFFFFFSSIPQDHTYIIHPSIHPSSHTPTSSFLIDSFFHSVLSSIYIVDIHLYHLLNRHIYFLIFECIYLFG